MAESKPKLDYRQIGATGLPIYGGRVYDEYVDVLSGEKGRRILREMSEQDPIIAGIILGIEMLARQVNWIVQPAASDRPSAVEAAQYVDSCLSDMSPSWEETLSEILSMLTYGWSWFEILYKRRQGLSRDPLRNSKFNDGKIGWRGWSIRGQETLQKWLYDDEHDPQELVGMEQIPPPTFSVRQIPRAKSLHFRTRSRRQNPEGVSMLRGAFRPWYMKKNIETIEGIGIERDLAGLPVMWVPANLLSSEATPEETQLLATLKKIVTTIRRDEQEGIIMPLAYDEGGKQVYDLKLLSTGGQRQFDTDKIVQRYDQRIAMSMMADFILLGHDAVGSFALSDNKTHLFAVALGAILDLIVAEINANAIPTLILLNGWALEDTPSLSHGDIESSDLGKLGTFLKQLGESGMPIFPNAQLEKYLLEQAGLPTSGMDAYDLDRDRIASPIDAEELARLAPSIAQINALAPEEPAEEDVQAEPDTEPRAASETPDVLPSLVRSVRRQAIANIFDILKDKLGREPTPSETHRVFKEWEREYMAATLLKLSRKP